MKESKWQGFTLDTTHDQVRRLFEKRYGHLPKKIVQAGCILLAGPIGVRPRSLTSRVEVDPMTKERAREKLRQLNLFEVMV